MTEIEPWYDIDRPDDLERALDDMRGAELSDGYELQRVIENSLAAAAMRKTTAKS